MSDFKLHSDDAVAVQVTVDIDLSSGDKAVLQLYDGDRQHIGTFSTTIDAANNIIEFASDLLPLEAGYYLAEFDIEFADGGQLTVPNDSEEVIEVYK